MRPWLLPLVALLISACVAPVPALAETGAPPPTLAVLDVELVDRAGEPRDQTKEHATRQAALHQRLSTELAERGTYRVVDLAPIRAAMDAARARTWLHGCNGCEVKLGQAAGATRVLVVWINKVSTMEMSLWAELWQTAPRRLILRKVLDFRGDTDLSWSRVGAYLVDRLAELPIQRR